MPRDYLHNHADFPALLRIVGADRKIDPGLVEKDYWIMHCLYGLQRGGFRFELKGGTSLSKGYGAIDRFSEDIDIQIEPPEGRDVKTGRNQNKPAQVKTRKDFYDWLAKNIRIDGIKEVARDTTFDDLPDYRGGGIRLHYDPFTDPVEGLKDGVLLEAGFDTVAPNAPKDISSWAYDYAAGRGIEIIDNRAMAVPCYEPGYTLVEKLQTISTKFRQQQKAAKFPPNFMRHYYDVYCLLGRKDAQAFIGTDDYKAHKEKRFRRDDEPDIQKNEAFVLSDPKVRGEYEKAYAQTSALYYRGKPAFGEIVARIAKNSGRL